MDLSVILLGELLVINICFMFSVFFLFMYVFACVRMCVRMCVFVYKLCYSDYVEVIGILQVDNYSASLHFL